MSAHPPFFDARFILHEDADLLVLDKPPGVACQSVDPTHPDDLAHRATQFLRMRDGRAPALGIHQRLDRDTSGVYLLAKSDRANRSLARQFEERSVRKEYVAGVLGLRGGRRRLDHRLTELEQGRVRVTTADDPRGRQALADLVPIERRGERALVGISLHTGRTHQIRVQLAAIGAPIAGDALYGSAPATRMLLHASSLAIQHPANDKEIVFRSKVPALFKRWLAGEDGVPLDDETAVYGALERAFRARAGLYEARHDERRIEAYRLLHGRGDGVPGLAVDVWGEHLVAHLYEALAPDAENGVLDALHGLGFEGVYLKRRPGQANVVVDSRREDLAPHAPLRGRPAPEAMVVHEHGIPYEVRLGDGLQTGLFLDQRDNRRRVRDLSPGRRVLNLFAYTCGFSCAAGAGEAQSVISVDAAAPALAWGERNFSLGAYRATHETVRADVFRWLELAQRSELRFDLVVCDPPTYSSTRESRWSSGADWSNLAEQVLSVVAPSGVVFFCSNDGRLGERSFRRQIQDALSRLGRRGALRSYDPPTDHPTAPGGEASMKTVRVML